MSFELKAVAGRNILYVMAVDAEYGPCLRGRIAPLMTGVGPVEAAVSLTRALAEFDAKGSLPDLVVSPARPAPRPRTDRSLPAISVAYRDMDASPLGFEKGATPFLDLPAVVKLPLSIPGVRKARLSTGADIVSGNAYEQIDADMVEMETFAVLRACQAFGVPLIGLRGISDGKAELKHVGDWTEYLHVIDEKLAAAVDQLEAALEKGEIQL
ncbi:S-adenosylhomocysteine nucleosidase [Sinorhizobium meliloti CCBAU 01290]|nr:S-adenosylhomocysteine nucleosidase [Sinorhizobium meliloti CCBAU 01290]